MTRALPGHPAPDGEAGVHPGDAVLYNTRGGWGYGETVHLLALVVKLHRTMATIELLRRDGTLVQKRVAITSLAPFDKDEYERRRKRYAQSRRGLR